MFFTLVTICHCHDQFFPHFHFLHQDANNPAKPPLNPIVLAAIGILSPTAIVSAIGAFLRWWLRKRRKVEGQTNQIQQQPTPTMNMNLTSPTQQQSISTMNVNITVPAQATRDLIEEQLLPKAVAVAVSEIPEVEIPVVSSPLLPKKQQEGP